ncbi:methyltransferase type 11 [Nannochloropsis oceanica]
MAAAAPEPKKEGLVAFDKDHYPDGLNANFLEPDAEGLEAKYAGAKGLFTDPETRDIARNVADIIKALGDLTGKKIVDLGAGTGLFLVPLDAAVGKEGHVYAVEISPGFIELLQKKKETEGLRNTTVARGSVTDMGLPADLQADIVLLVDVYHHIEYVQTYMKNVRKGMRKGGKLVLIDFHRIPGKIWSHPPDWVLSHVRAGQEVFKAEIEEAGFELEREITLSNLQENYFLIFVNP